MKVLANTFVLSGRAWMHRNHSAHAHWARQGVGGRE